MKINSEYFVEPGGRYSKLIRRLPYIKKLSRQWTPPDFVKTPHNVGFSDSIYFIKAYEAAIEATGFDYRIPWRIHQAIWAAHHALNVEGDFVELGTGKGFVMTAVLHSFDDWGVIDKNLWLYDLFKSYYDSGKGEEKSDKYYARSIDEVKLSFDKFDRVRFVPGDVLETVNDSGPDKISFLHVDLNDSFSEVFCIEKLWPRVSSGAVVILDDYANKGHEDQYKKINELFFNYKRPVLTTASGQGIVIK